MPLERKGLTRTPGFAARGASPPCKIGPCKTGNLKDGPLRNVEASCRTFNVAAIMFLTGKGVKQVVNAR